MTAAAEKADPPIGQAEFIALIGTLFATIAFSIDAMLPALPAIGAELSPDDPQLAPLILTSFVLGMGFGTFFVGPLSDAFGRRPVIFAGTALYIIAAIWAFFAGSLESALAARVLAGIGVAAPRIVTLAIVRDLYSGRVMARIFSFAMTVFTVFPAVAPLIGDAIIHSLGWRSIFLAFIMFAAVSVGWLALRLPEPLPPEARRPLAFAAIAAGVVETLRLRQMQLSILVQTIVFGILFGMISSVQSIFDQTYGQAETFPWWFFFIALLAFPAAPLNGVLVTRLGMRPLVRRALIWSLIFAIGFAGTAMTGIAGRFELWLFFFWSVTLFGNVAFTIGNLNALALEPLGHIAGLASSLMAGLSTVGGAVIGSVIGQFFDGTPVPMALSTAVLSALAIPIMVVMPRER
ncbi:MAG: multidrug effflux MFS transporter [Pseudomonadota bacterium]